MIQALVAAAILAQTTVDHYRTIAGSVDPIVGRMLQEGPLELISRTEFEQLKARVELNEHVRDFTIGCISESLIGTGIDLGTTAVGGARCEECAEANPLGLNIEARVGMKFFQTGAEVGTCLLEAKKKHESAADNHSGWLKWAKRVARAIPIVINGYSIVTGKPLIKWGTPSRETLK